jgi:hypothetical protein
MKPEVTAQCSQDPTAILHAILQSCASIVTILFNILLAFMPTRHLQSLLFILPNNIYSCYMSNFISGLTFMDPCIMIRFLQK